MFITDIKNLSPKNIVSLVPSITSLLHYLQLEIETVGITKFCIHPTIWFKTKTRIGGTKKIDVEKIKILKPDLIICSKEENVAEQINEIAKYFPVYLTDVTCYEDALQMISNIGTLTGKEKKATTLINDLNTVFNKKIAANNEAIYLIWQEPYMTVGGDTYINSMMQLAGFKNLFADTVRYPIITVEEIKILHPAFVLLSSEPYPFKQKHIKALQFHLPKSNILLVDGEIFSWYGDTMLKAPAYFNKLLKQFNKG